MDSYKELLKRAYTLMPERKGKSERFEPPTANMNIEGNKTIITNFKEISRALHRNIKHLTKYFTKELAVPGDVDGSRLILKARIPPRTITKKLNDYINDFVLCKECKRPDTDIKEINGVKMLVCTACGARSAVRDVK